MKSPFTIGITGGSGSGKTFFINELASRFEKKELCLISQDNYYKPKHLQSIDSQGVENFDLPEAIDREAFVNDILKIKRGEIVTRDEYTFNNLGAVQRVIKILPAPILIVEGLFIFGYPEIEKELNLKVYIDAKDHIKLTRRIVRDNQERGYDLSDVLYRYENHVMPIYESFIQPLKGSADLIIPNDKNFEGAMDIIVQALKTKLS
jgi:uridine kinase